MSCLMKQHGDLITMAVHLSEICKHGIKLVSFSTVCIGAGGSITDSDDEADAVDAEGVPLFMWQALGDLGAPVAPPEPQPFDGA